MFPLVLVRNRKAIAHYLAMKFYGSLTPPWMTVKIYRAHEQPAASEEE